jgi:VanZ family protein
MLLKTWIWVLFELAIVFILLSLPASNFHTESNWFGNFPIDKLVHVCLFGSLSFSILVHFEKSKFTKLKTVRAHAYVLIFCILYGIGMEYYQKYYVPSRGFDVNDMLADAAGAIIALPVLYRLKKRKLSNNRA